jgi:hypothetical protein
MNKIMLSRHEAPDLSQTEVANILISSRPKRRGGALNCSRLSRVFPARQSQKTSRSLSVQRRENLNTKTGHSGQGVTNMPGEFSNCTTEDYGDRMAEVCTDISQILNGQPKNNSNLCPKLIPQSGFSLPVVRKLSMPNVKRIGIKLQNRRSPPKLNRYTLTINMLRQHIRK